MFRRVLVFCALMTVPATTWATPFQNGSFETASVNPGGGFIILPAASTAITGWTVLGSSIDYIGGYWQADEGVRSLDLNGNAGPSGISQTFDTLPGASYRVDFAMAGNPDGAPATKTLIASGGAFVGPFSFTIPSGTTHTNMNWAQNSFVFTATGSTSTLTFQSITASDFFGPALDNVRVTAVPEPATWSLLGIGLAGLAFRRRLHH